MSTIVQPRREAASYVSTHAGAVGEIIIDTTNSRSTVHDGSKLGGYPHAKISDLVGRNRIINGNFAINQRGYASGASLGSAAYAHDRWQDAAGGSVYSFTQAVPDTTVSITSGSLQQAIEPSSIEGGTYVLSWTGTATANVFYKTTGAYGLAASGSSPLAVTGVPVGATVLVRFSTGTLGLVQFEALIPGGGPTTFERRMLSVEMAMCQRYLEFLSNIIYSTYSAASGLAFYFSAPMKVVKRAVPTVTLSSIAVSGFTTTPGLNAVSADQVIVVLTTNAVGNANYAQFSVKMEAEL